MWKIWLCAVNVQFELLIEYPIHTLEKSNEQPGHFYNVSQAMSLLLLPIFLAHTKNLKSLVGTW